MAAKLGITHLICIMIGCYIIDLALISAAGVTTCGSLHILALTPVSSILNNILQVPMLHLDNHKSTGKQHGQHRHSQLWLPGEKCPCLVSVVCMFRVLFFDIHAKWRVVVMCSNASKSRWVLCKSKISSICCALCSYFVLVSELLTSIF